MKIMITMILSASFIAASSGTTAEEGLMKAIAAIDHAPAPLISVKAVNRSAHTQHIRELHGEVARVRVPHSKALKHERRLAKFKARLRKQKQARLSGLSRSKVTASY